MYGAWSEYHITFTIYSNLLILDTIVQVTLSSHHGTYLRRYLVFESGPAEISICEFGLSSSHTSIPIPWACPSVLSFTAEVVLVSGPKWFKYSHKMNTNPNDVVSGPAETLLTLWEGQGCWWVVSFYSLSTSAWAVHFCGTKQLRERKCRYCFLSYQLHQLSTPDILIRVEQSIFPVWVLA